MDQSLFTDLHGGTRRLWKQMKKQMKQTPSAMQVSRTILALSFCLGFVILHDKQ
jgi:hypothetical protein